MPKLLTPEQIQQNLSELEFNWEVREDRLVIEVETQNFTDALWLVNEAGQVAEELSHHPNLAIHDYKFVTIATTTHSSSGITAKDFSLAERIDAVISRVGK